MSRMILTYFLVSDRTMMMIFYKEGLNLPPQRYIPVKGVKWPPGLFEAFLKARNWRQAWESGVNNKKKPK